MNAAFVEYSECIGKILANLQALEFSLRQYLYAKQDSPFTGPMRHLNDLALGEEVPENALTDWSSLGRLIARYNTRIAHGHPELVVDPSAIELRDALSHGRMWLPDLASGPILLKFERPTSGMTRVTFKQVVSSEWLAAAIQRLGAEIAKVQEAIRLVGTAAVP